MKRRWGGLALALGLLASGPKALADKCEDAVAQVESRVFVSTQQAQALVDFVRENNVDLIMRPLNAEALALRMDNHPPKPKSIKWKTCNDDDERLFPHRENGRCKGLVILYNPQGPEPTQSSLRDRWNQRKKEWEDYTKKKDSMYPSTAAEAVARGAVAYLENGFVKHPTEHLAFTGDLDIFDITKPNGFPPGSREMMSKVQKLIRVPAIDVLHGVHMNWAPSASERHIYTKIVDAHRTEANGGEGKPLVKLGADCTVCDVYAPGLATTRVQPKDQRYPCGGPAAQTGPADAGTPDAGTPDTGTPDAGAPDTGTPDAGTTAAAEPAAQVTHILLSDVCTKVRITGSKHGTFNFVDESGYESFIWKDQWEGKRCGQAKNQPWPGVNEPEAPKEKAEYMYIKLNNACTKVKILGPQHNTLNYEDLEGHTSFIWENEWAETRCGESSAKPWPGKKERK